MERKDPFEQSHPYLVACELANQQNSLNALLMACMMKAEGPAHRRLVDAFPNVHANLINYTVAYRKQREK
jgi:hypothetical protein